MAITEAVIRYLEPSPHDMTAAYTSLLALSIDVGFFSPPLAFGNISCEQQNQFYEGISDQHPKRVVAVHS